MYKILIIDDEIEYLQRMFQIIRKHLPDCKVQRLSEPELVITVAEKAHPDIIITDWQMPEMSGIELLKELKQHEKLKHIPVIMCTGIMTTPKNLQTALDAGAVDYIRKPVDEVELIARIKSAVRFVDTMRHTFEQEKVISMQEKVILQNEIERRDRELTSQALMLAQRETEIIEIVQKLKELLQKSESKEVQRIIHEIVVKLHQNTPRNVWEMFLKRFEEVHPDFAVNLLLQFSELTSNDLKTCAFLRLNMTSKEIAEITGVNPQTVDITRHRIRKKLGLQKNDNLFTFLSQL